MASPELVEQGETRRDELMKAIREFREEHGFSPTVRECATAVGLSVNMTKRHIERLVVDGRLTRVPGVGRSMVPAEEV